MHSLSYWLSYLTLLSVFSPETKHSEFYTHYVLKIKRWWLLVAPRLSKVTQSKPNNMPWNLSWVGA